jgi:thiol-disulfide isomerase/thioredoxin
MRAHASMSIAPMGNYYYLTQLSKRVSSELPSSTYASAIDATLMKEAEGRVGVVASGLTGTDLDGKPFDLMALRGKPVMLMFWASYCEFSRMEFAKLKEMQQVFADAGRTLVCFSIDDHDADWRNFLKTAGLDWATHLRGMNGQQSAEIKQFKVKAIPSTYMINADGVIETIDVRADELAGYFGNPKAPQPIAVPE